MEEASSPHLNRVRECFPALLISSVCENTEGLINDILIINDELVCRFPKNDDWGRRLLANEVKIIELARQYVGVRLPEFVYVADDFVAYHYIAGDALQRHDILALDELAQDRVAGQLAAFLHQLHHIPMREVEGAGILQSDVNRGREVWLRLFEDVRRELFPAMLPHAREWVNEHFEPILQDAEFMSYQPALINGDVTPYHILFDKERAQVNGIIDFGTAGIGDPAADFACIIYNYGESFLRRMAKFYGGVGTVIERARFWAGTLELQWILRGIRSKQTFWFTAHFGSAHDMLPIGSGW